MSIVSAVRSAYASGFAFNAPGGAGDDQAAGGGGGGAAGVDVLPHVSGDGDHGVSVERRDARARPADRRPRVAEDDEAVRPDGGQDLARRDRTHRDLGETRRAGPVQGQAVLPSSSTTPPSSRARRRGASGDALGGGPGGRLPAGWDPYAGRPGPRGAWSAGCPTDRAGGTDRVCTEGGARDDGAGLGAGARFGASPCTRPPRPARREEPVRATGYEWAVSLGTPEPVGYGAMACETSPATPFGLWGSGSSPRLRGRGLPQNLWVERRAGSPRQTHSVPVCSPPSRRVAPLRPRCAGLTAWTPAARTSVPALV